MKQAYQVSEGAYFVPTYFDTTIVQAFDARTIVEISGPSIEENEDQKTEAQEPPFGPTEAGQLNGGK